MPAQGINTGLALRKAETLLKGAGHSTGNILLITDEVDLPGAESVAEDLDSQGYRVSVLGIGTDHGAPILNEDGSFLKDASGEIVIPVLKQGAMRKLAGSGGGLYRRMTTDDKDISYLLLSMNSLAVDETEATTEFETDTWREQGPWLLLLLLPLSALAFRRGYLMLICLFLIPLPRQASALDWDSLWLREDQRAKRQLDAGNTEAAASMFSDPAWKAVSQYRSGDFESTVDSLDRLDDTVSMYNQGNALARLGEYEKAIEKYQLVLDQDPDNADASFNKELLEEELKKQQQQQQQSSQDQQQQANDQQQQQQGQNNEDQQEQQEQGQQETGKQQGSSDSPTQQNDSEQNSEEEQQAGKQPRDEEQQQSEQQQAKPEQADDAADEGDESQLAQARADDSSEEQRATEQWLRRIPDDPAGLLRRKFRYQYQQRQRPQREEEKKW